MNDNPIVGLQRASIEECPSAGDDDCNAFSIDKDKSSNGHEHEAAVDDDDNQNSDNFKIRLTHLDEFPDTIGLDMYDSDLLFPDYTLNLS